MMNNVELDSTLLGGRSAPCGMTLNSYPVRYFNPSNIMSNINNNLFYEIDNYCFRPLFNAGEVHLAEKLLYDCYITEQHWDVNPDNPSIIKTKSCGKNCHCLTDYFCDKAYWFGAFKEGKLIGCFRVLKYPCTELGRYFDLPSWLINNHPCELNRLVIHPDFRHRKVVTLMLLRISFDYAFKLSNMVYVTADKLNLSKLYVKMGLLGTGIFFKYDEKDINEVELLYVESKDKFSSALYKITDMYIHKNTNLNPENNKLSTKKPEIIPLDPTGKECPLYLLQQKSEQTGGSTSTLT